MKTTNLAKRHINIHPIHQLGIYHVVDTAHGGSQLTVMDDFGNLVELKNFYVVDQEHC